MPPIRQVDGGIAIDLRVQPKASRSEFRRDGDRLRASITAPPVDGEANRVLCECFAKRLGVPKRAVRIERGEHSREKTVRIDGVTISDVESLFAPKT